jgi:hypothetical protein
MVLTSEMVQVEVWSSWIECMEGEIGVVGGSFASPFCFETNVETP